MICLVNEGHSHSSGDFAECDNEKYRSRPVFIFGRVVARDTFACDSGNVRRTVALPGAITKNNIFFFGWYLMRQRVRRTGSKA